MAKDSDPPTDHLQTSQRDEAELAERLQAWLDTRPDVPAGVNVVACSRPDANGMSSETLLFDTSEPVSVTAGETAGGTALAGRTTTGRYVARLEPASDACPIFPTYNLEAQARAMRLVAAHTAVPVPHVHWFEPDPAPLGGAFLVMSRVDGEVPPDVMPYTCDGSWVHGATAEQRARMQERTVEVLGEIHSVPIDGSSLTLPAWHGAAGDRGIGASGALRRHVESEREYFAWARDGLRFPLIERALDWLEAHWPEGAGAADGVLCWGDARIGNILYRDFEPVGVLDWEMATVGPRELDVAWMIFMHQFFDDVTRDLGMAGLPDFLQRDEVAEQYARATGHEPRDLEWFVVYAALRHGIFMTRAMRRRVLFGEMDMPDDPEDLILHRRTLEAMIS